MDEANKLLKGTRAYRQANLALFLAGFVTFTALYDFQPLFPNLVADYGITPAVASLALSCATFSLACTLPISGSLSDALGRRALMGGAVILAPLLTLGAAYCESYQLLLLLRLAQGIVLAGVPAVAMAYLNEEVEPVALPGAMGLYIAGNACGGMTGRILTAGLLDLMSWRWAIGTLSVVCLVLGVLFLVMIPPSRNFTSQPFRLVPLTKSLFRHLQNPGLLCLFVVAFACMGGFVTVYNYVTFRLLGPDYQLSQGQVGLIFLAYAFGAFGSSLVGGLINRFGRSRVLFASLTIMAAGLILTLSGLPGIIAGIVILTVGFFGAHSVASAWVGLLASHSRAQASSLYLFSYYLGSSVSGTGGGYFYGHWGWNGVVLLVLALIGVAGMAGMHLGALNRAPGALPTILGQAD